MRTLYLESVAGIAGDMFTAAFLDAGLVDPEEIRSVPALLGLDEASVEITPAERAGARCTHLRVALSGAAGHGEHRHHHYPALVRRLEASRLEPGPREFALRVFRLLAEAEGDAHGVPLEGVVFHEVGAADSLVDVAMAGVCVDRVGADRVLASPVKLGRGTILMEHGTHPVPPPASARLALGLPVAPVPPAVERENVELSTPTGLAILRALEPAFAEGWPGGTPVAQGSGAGTMELGAYPNIFRVALLEGAETAPLPLPYERDQVVEIRCNVDDQTGERSAWLTERALAMGALDAWIEPLVGKKGRPAACIVLLAEPGDLSRFADLLLRQSSSFGIRYAPWDRLKLVRSFETRDTPRGPLTFSVGRTTGGEKVKEKPEYEELKRIWEGDPGFRP